MEPQSQSIVTYEYLKKKKISHINLYSSIKFKLSLGCVALGAKKLRND